MNKKLMAAAVAGALAIPGLAFAQSSVTLYGTIDAGIKNMSKVGAGSDTVTYVSNGLHTTNRWGMKGSEDLGGGLKANFKLEGGYDNGTGEHSAGKIFERGSWVGLSSGGNSVEIGRDYTANFKVLGKYDPFSYNYTGITPAVQYTGGVRASNMIQGQVSFNGLTLLADWGLGEVPGNSSAGRHTAIGGYWSGNGLTIGAAAASLNDATNAGSRKDTTIGGAYSMNAFTFRAGWSQIKYDQAYGTSTTAATYVIDNDPTSATYGTIILQPASTTMAKVEKSRMIMLGVQYAFSDRVKGRVGYYDIKDTGFTSANDGKVKTTLIGVDYSLSKRTTAYVELDHHALDGARDGAYKTEAGTLNDGATGVGVGIAHAF